MTLRGRLLWMVVVLLLPTLALFVWIVEASYEHELDAAHRQLRETTRALSLVVDRELDQRAATARALASSPFLTAGELRSFYDQAKAVTDGTDNWAVLVDRDDQLLNTLVPFGTPLPKRTWMPDRPLARGDHVEVSNLRIGPVSKQPVLVVYAGRRGVDPPRYNVGVVFTPAALQKIMIQQSLPEGWTAAVLDREYSIVARTPDPQAWVGKKARDDLVAGLVQRNEGFIEGVSMAGVPTLAFFSRSPVHGWAFVIGVPKQILGGSARQAARESAGAAALLAVFALALAAWAARRIRAPIKMLEAAAGQLERDEVPDFPPTGLAEADAVGAVLRRAGLLAKIELTERAQAIGELRHNEESQRLLVQLNDATRGLRDVVQVQREIVARVARHFGVSRCAYGEVDATLQCVSIERDHADGVRSITAALRLDDFGADLRRRLEAGRTVLVSDVHDDPLTQAPAVRVAFDVIETRAWLCVPLLREGRLVALLMLNHREPRGFRADEAVLLEQVAERAWFAIDRARAESALHESRDVLSLAMRSGKMGAWSRDLVTDRVWWSHELEDLYGLAPGAFGGDMRAFRVMVHPEDEPVLAAAVAHAVTQHEDYAVEFRFRHANGEWRWMEGRGRALYGADGHPSMLYGLGMDISARKHTEEELRRLNDELSLAHRRKDEFLATLAHELRNPLAPITSALEILRLKHPVDADTRWTRDLIDRQVRQLTRLVDDLLDVARITRGKIHLRRERVALATLVQAAIEAAQPFITAAGHQLAVNLPEVPIWLDADPTRLTQMLLNLLTNAAKYTPHGGQLAIDASTQGGEALIVVRDSGIGIAPEHLASVFEMFSQVAPALERSQGGLGIGLALARGVIELHGGSIAAHSEGLGRGSEFRVRLPLAGAGHLLAPGTPAAAAPPDTLCVLVVDDNRDAAESLGMLLELVGHEVALAYDGESALEAAARIDPDVVLLDIGMPGMNGYEVVRRLRATPGGHAALVIALTGWGQDEDRRRALAAGFDHHLTKPVDPAHLQRVLDSRRAQGSSRPSP